MAIAYVLWVEMKKSW